MRDFHSLLRDTPFLDRLRGESIYVPHGRGQGHHQGDSLNAELTGVWTARCCDSRLGPDGFRRAHSAWLPRTVPEAMGEAGLDVITRIAQDEHDLLGTHAVGGGMRNLWLKEQPERLAQFARPRPLDLDEWIEEVRRSDRCYAHVFLRQTHRPWDDPKGLYALVGEVAPDEGWGYPHDASCARRAALQAPSEFAAHRRKGLAKADRVLERIFEATRDLDDVTYLVYSNHGEVFDHFRYQLPHPDDNEDGMILGTSHGAYPYEVLYANTQMWLIPGREARVMRGTGRSIDIAPTLLDLAGAPDPSMDGESMLPLFDSGRFPERDRYAENQIGACVSMVRADGWKFISTGVDSPNHPPRHAPDFHRLAVFDLRSDPHEQVNLVDTPQGGEMLEWALERHHELERDRVVAYTPA
jgi:arylsulfatase A-like enzyme